jgi:hypothetical protein
MAEGVRKQRTEAMRQCQPYSWGFASLLWSCEVSGGAPAPLSGG